MDPLVSTIVKQSLFIFGCITLAGFLIAAGYLAWQYGNLQYARTLNVVPSQIS